MILGIAKTEDSRNGLPSNRQFSNHAKLKGDCAESSSKAAAHSLYFILKRDIQDSQKGYTSPMLSARVADHMKMECLPGSQQPSLVASTRPRSDLTLS